nr:hypothetical protein [Tanacetum cinerariifolium]
MDKKEKGLYCRAHELCSSINRQRILPKNFAKQKKGPKGYEELKTHNKKEYATFFYTCYAMGLLDDDKEYIESIKDTHKSNTANYCRNLFVMLITENTLLKPAHVWEQTYNELSDDIESLRRRELNMPTLVKIDQQLKSRGSSLKDIQGMPLADYRNKEDWSNVLIQEELNFKKNEMQAEHASLYSKMTDEQREVYNTIMKAIDSRKGDVFFLYAYGGTDDVLIKTDGDTLKAMVEAIYPTIDEEIRKDEYFENKTILVSTNEEVDLINEHMLSQIENVNARFVNTLYGYFIGDRLAFPLVENYVKNTWAKYGLKRIQLHEEFFFSNLILKRAWKIGKPLMLDSYTSNMCLNSWGRSAYAREGHTFATIDIEYEWTPPRCASCRIFDHVSEKCPKLPKVASSEKVIEEGFIERVDKGKLSKINNGVANKESTDRGPIQITTKNSFSALSEETDTNLKDNEGVNADGQTPIESQFVNDSDEDVINDNKLSMCAILESHVATHNLERLCKHVFKNWNWISNAMSCLKGTRIIVGWNQNDVDVTVIHQDPQVIHARIWIKADRKEFFLLFCDGILRKLDRVLANLEFLDVFMGVHAVFKPYRISDHSLAVLSIPSLVKVKPMPFKFFNIIILDNRFKDVVRNAWMAQIFCFYMFRVVKKLKGLKKPIRKLMFDKGNLHANVTRLRGELDKVQTDLDCDPSNFSLRDKEAMTVADFNEALLMEEKFLKQKAKITWLKEGDSNTAYFHKMVKSRVSQNRIDVVMDAYGNVHHSTEVAKAFINHYELFLGQPGNTSAFNTDNLFPTTLNENEALDMVSDISSQEVKSAMFSMGNDKSPGLDGFTAAFFKDTWDIIGVDVIKAVKDINGSLHGHFEGKQGLRQADPLSPYLFTLIMEVFTLMLKRRVSETSSFTYHRFCSELNLINLCFADDLFLFAHGDVNSLKVIKDALDDFKDALDDFKDASGLNPSMPKSKAYFCNVINYTKLVILNILPFEEDHLPVKYLGVPLVSSRLIARDCKELIDKV